MINWGHILGPALLVYILYKWPYELKINWESVKYFLKLEAAGVFVRGVWIYFFPEFFPKVVVLLCKSLDMTKFMSVYWEDAFYVLPIVLLDKYIQPRWIIYSALIFSAVQFGMGHLAQGIIVAIAMFIYVICCFRFRRSIGIGTFIICHIIHDMTITLQIKLMF